MTSNNKFFENLKYKLKKEAIICIIGLGYVGLELLKVFKKKILD